MPRLNINRWKCIHASERVLDWIQNGVPLIFKQCEPDKCFKNNVVHGKLIGIRKLIDSGAIKQVRQSDTLFVLPIKCMPKKQNKLRLVIDCRHTNEYIHCEKFSQEGI